MKPDAMSKEMQARGGRDYTRELVRQRDSRMCQECYKKWEPGQRRFDIHHLFECGSKSKAYDKVSEMDGLITYCHKCHMSQHIVREKMKNKTGMFKHSKEKHQHPFYNK